MTISGVAGNSFSPYMSIAPATATSSVSQVGSKNGQVRDEAAEYSWAMLDQLSPSDRSLVAAATGTPVPTRGSGASPVAPILAYQIAGDRQQGVLPVGKPVDEDYINNLIQQYSGQENPFGDALNRALDYLYSNKPQNSFDAIA